MPPTHIRVLRPRESTNILGAIGAVNIFIEAGLEKGGVLVHCAGGRSRSAAFVVAFIMSTQGCDYDHAYAQVCSNVMRCRSRQSFHVCMASL